MYYEITTLRCALLEQNAVSRAAAEWTARAEGELLGAWRTDIGELGAIVLLQSYATRDALDAERERTLRHERPFNVDPEGVSLTQESYRPFEFLPQVTPKTLGRFYEIRTYQLKPGGIAPTIAAWHKALEPAQAYTSHLVTNMYALDGEPRITHIWGFDSLDERAALRADHYARGVWPPAGGPEQIRRATSTICLPEDYSPLR